MKREYPIKIFYPFFVFMTLILFGCAIGGHDFEFGEPLGDQELDKIQPGITHKQKVLEMLGPPVAIARMGKVVKIPPTDPNKEGWMEIPSANFFELFATKQTLTQDHIIYYYFSSEISGMGGMFLFVIKGSSDLTVEKLWILINEKTGVVEDYVFREQN